MLPPPHGGKLIDRVLKGRERERVLGALDRLPRYELKTELAQDVMNIATGVYSPLEGFLGKDDLAAVTQAGRLSSGVPWTIPIVLDVTPADAQRLGPEVALCHGGEPFARLEVEETYRFDREDLARAVFGTTDARHPGVAGFRKLGELLIGGRVSVFRELASPVAKFRLEPLETRVLFEAKGWRTVVGFQTRNVPHLGHEHVQKNALTFVDGLLINPVIGKKKPGDFRDDVILSAYEALISHYYPKERVVLAVIETEMRYAGPREAIFHAIMRKNLGCTHFIVGRDHAGVGTFYAPYAAQEIFEQFPDLGIEPLFFTAAFHCGRCRGVVSEKTCPHRDERRDFSGSQFRSALLHGEGEAAQFVREEVGEAVRRYAEPFVAA
jgi:sulfate adenylyltransferase